MNDKSKFFQKIIIIESLAIVFLSLIVYGLYYHTQYTKNQMVYVFEKLLGLVEYCKDRMLLFIKLLVTEYSSFDKVFNNREWAIIILIVLVMIYLLFDKKIRMSFKKVLISIFQKKIILWILWLVLYNIFIVTILLKLGFWNISLFKSTCVWFLTVATVSTIRAVDKARDYTYFIGIVKDSVKLTAIITFITTLYTLSILGEFIFLFLALIVTLMITIINVQPKEEIYKYKQLKSILEVLLSLMGILYFTNSVRLLISNWTSVNKILLLKEFALPSILSIMLILYNYSFVLYAKYEVLFTRLSFKKTIEDKLRWYLYFRIIIACNFRIKRIDNFIKHSEIMTRYINKISDINVLIREFHSNRKTPIKSTSSADI